MKRFLKNKKSIIITLIILLIAIVGGSCFFLFGNKDNKSNNGKVLKEGEYVAYVKINPLVKLTFDASYYECTDKNGKVNICGEYTNKVTKAEYLNGDANSIYKDLDFKGKTINEVVFLLATIADENDYDIKNITITTDWNYDIDNISKMITEKIKQDTKVDVEIKFNYQKKINESSIIKNEDIDSYAVNFDTDGGTNVESQIILKDHIVEKPGNPTRDGYTFIEWQLDGKTFDFNSKIVKDITLTAKWEKVSNDNVNKNDNKNNDNGNNINNNQQNNNNNNQLSQKEQDNITLRNQLQEKGLQWDFNTEKEAWEMAYRWSEKGGYSGTVEKNSYGTSDTAYSVVVTLNASACHSNKIINIDWHNETPEMKDFIYYLHSLGYNCSGNTGIYNGKSFHINDKNEIVWD